MARKSKKTYLDYFIEEHNLEEEIKKYNIDLGLLNKVINFESNCMNYAMLSNCEKFGMTFGCLPFCPNYVNGDCENSEEAKLVFKENLEDYKKRGNR